MPKRRMLTATVVAAGAMASGAAGAATLDFAYHEDLGFFLIDASWTQPSLPSPIVALSGKFTDIAVSDGVYGFGVPGFLTMGSFSEVDFYNAASSGPLGPGGFEAGPVGDFGPQLFTGDETTPAFAPGTYSLAFGTLSVTSVPEPATWALMLIGFGGIGAMARSRPRAVTSAKG